MSGHEVRFLCGNSDILIHLGLIKKSSSSRWKSRDKQKCKRLPVIDWTGSCARTSICASKNFQAPSSPTLSRERISKWYQKPLFFTLGGVSADSECQLTWHWISLTRSRSLLFSRSQSRYFEKWQLAMLPQSESARYSICLHTMMIRKRGTSV
jgi:hypothetical protein